MSAVEHNLQTFETVWQCLEQVNDVTVFSVGETRDVTNRSTNRSQLVGSHQRFDFVFELVVEFVPTACEELDAVIWRWVVRSRDHHAEVGIHVGGKKRGGRGWQNAGIENVNARTG